LHLSKELFFLNSGIKFVIGLTIAGFANLRSFAEMPSRPFAFFEFALFIYSLWGRQSKAFDKSTRMAATDLFSSSAFLQSSIIFRRAV
jgi:hypothetical protein